MQTQNAHSDFALFPPKPQNQVKMLALEPSRQQQLPYFQPYTMDPALTDPFGLQMDQLTTFGQSLDPSRVPQSYLDTPPVYSESGSDANKAPNFPSTTPPTMPTSQPTEQHIVPGLSSASGPSIASASSSAIGSPYSGHVQSYQENWVDTSHGLGLPAAVMGDLFPNDFMGSALDQDGLYQKKPHDNYVGESQDISSNVQSAFPVWASHHTSPFQPGTPGDEHEAFPDNPSARGHPTTAIATSGDDSSSSMMPPQCMASPGAPLFASPSTPAPSSRSFSNNHSPVPVNLYQSQTDVRSTKATYTSPTSSPNNSSAAMPSEIPTQFRGSFFQQSSGHFMPPLESSCWFSLTYPLQRLAF